MYVVRPVELADIAALEALAAVPMPGVHTLPKTREKILAMIERSIASFAAHVDIPSEEAYLLVLESLGDKSLGDESLPDKTIAVSYTHLTLPTILLV